MDAYLKITSLLLIVSCFTVSCKKKDSMTQAPPVIFQGPQNPSFESGSAGVAANWSGGWTRTPAKSPPFPTDGSYYMSAYMAKDTTIDLYQDNVNLSSSKQISFDLSVVLPNPSSKSDSVKFYVLFNSSKLDTILSKKWAFFASSGGNDTLGVSMPINLPSLPQSGRLIFRAQCITSGVYSVVNIDNIKVQ